MASETCKECSGLGKYVGLQKIMSCESCDGTGVQDAIGVDSKESDAVSGGIPKGYTYWCERPGV